MIEIILSELNRSVASHALLESYGGYAGKFLPTYLNSNSDDLRALSEKLKGRKIGNESICLSTAGWRLIVEAINAVIYELGPEELQTITGHELKEFLNTGRVIYSNVYNRKCSQMW